METHLPLACFRIELQAQTPIVFHHYSGSAWRGVFGRALRKTACVTGQRQCSGCLLYRSCVYSYLFETPPPADTRYMRRYTAAPHPFILQPDPQLRQLAPGQRTTLQMALAGKGAEYLPYVLHALEKAGQQGIGPKNGRFIITGVQQAQTPDSDNWISIYHSGALKPLPARPPEPPRLPGVITLTFTTPTRVKHQGRILSPNHFPFAGIIANLLRRYSMMSYFHGEQPFDADFRELIDQARSIEPEFQQLQWQNWSRYSTRQRRKIEMGGVTGELRYRGETIAPYWPLLWTGQWLHLGKGATMGLGRYRITPGLQTLPERDLRCAAA